MFSLRYVISRLVFDILSYTNKFVKKWIFYQTSALMTTDNSVLSVHEQIFAGDIMTYLITTLTLGLRAPLVARNNKKHSRKNAVNQYSAHIFFG